MHVGSLDLPSGLKIYVDFPRESEMVTKRTRARCENENATIRVAKNVLNADSFWDPLCSRLFKNITTVR